MRLPLVAILAAGALTGACDGDNSVRISSTASEPDDRGVLKVIDTLQCPETMGVLTRKGSAHAGGATCLYSGPRGATVSLQLVRLETGSADGVLDQLRLSLSSDMPRTAAELRASADAAKARAAADTAALKADTARVEAEDARTAANAVSGDHATIVAPGVSVDAQGDRAVVRLPGMSVDSDGDKASVRIGGLSISADSAGERVDIQSADERVSVQAHDDAAEIRTRAPGDAIRTTYMLTDSRPADAGWRLVGYEARGPMGGPIVIATVHGKDRDSDAVFDAAKALVTLNVGE